MSTDEVTCTRQPGSSRHLYAIGGIELPSSVSYQLAVWRPFSHPAGPWLTLHRDSDSAGRAARRAGGVIIPVRHEHQEA